MALVGFDPGLVCFERLVCFECLVCFEPFGRLISLGDLCCFGAFNLLLFALDCLCRLSLGGLSCFDGCGLDGRGLDGRGLDGRGLDGPLLCSIDDKGEEEFMLGCVVFGHGHIK